MATDRSKDTPTNGNTIPPLAPPARSPSWKPGEQEPAGGPEPRTGVFVCGCGDRISGMLDVEALTEAAGRWPGVAFADHAPYWCSPAGRDVIEEVIHEHGLDRVVVAGCSLRTHRKLFRETLRAAKLDPELLGLVNIREGCAWAHQQQPDAANVRARDQVRMEVAQTTSLIPREPAQVPISPGALVIGGGAAGLTAALELADAGIPVTLVERSASLGGKAENEAPESAAELIDAAQDHAGIDVRLESRIADVEGSVGCYRASLRSGNGATAGATSLQDPALPSVGPFGAVIIATGVPDDETRRLAGMLRLPRDERGHLAVLRARLRPERYLERGIWVCGDVHHPCDSSMAQLQAFSAASRALRHLRKGQVTLSGPRAEVAATRCTGCSDCADACPFTAISMIERSASAQFVTAAPGESVSLASIDPLLCTGCGNCVSVCPVQAATLTGWSDAQLTAQMEIALNGNSSVAAAAAAGRSQAPRPDRDIGDREPRVLVFACEWSGHAALELAGAQRRSYPANVRVIRLDCTGRLQPGLIFSAFELGAAGVLVLGCGHGLCHYERGNERAAAACAQVEELSGMLGLDPARLRLEWSPPDDGAAVAELVTEFVDGVARAVGSA